MLMGAEILCVPGGFQKSVRPSGEGVKCSYSWVARDVSKKQTKKLSILLSFYFHDVLQCLNTFT